MLEGKTIRIGIIAAIILVAGVTPHLASATDSNAGGSVSSTMKTCWGGEKHEIVFPHGAWAGYSPANCWGLACWDTSIAGTEVSQEATSDSFTIRGTFQAWNGGNDCVRDLAQERCVLAAARESTTGTYLGHETFCVLDGHVFANVNSPGPKSLVQTTRTTVLYVSNGNQTSRLILNGQDYAFQDAESTIPLAGTITDYRTGSVGSYDWHGATLTLLTAGDANACGYTGNHVVGVGPEWGVGLVFLSACAEDTFGASTTWTAQPLPAA